MPQRNAARTWTPTVPSKRTTYNRTEYRSRLEARWVWFFRKIKLKALYEPRTYRLTPSLVYIPDFWMPEARFFFEAKGQWPLQVEFDKMQKLCQQQKVDGFLFVDIPIKNAGIAFFSSGMIATDARWGQCATCEKIQIIVPGRVLPCYSHTLPGHVQMTPYLHGLLYEASYRKFV